VSTYEFSLNKYTVYILLQLTEDSTVKQCEWDVCFNRIFFFFLPYMFLYICIILSRYGKIVSTKAILDKTTNKCKGMFAFILRSPG